MECTLVLMVSSFQIHHSHRIPSLTNATMAQVGRRRTLLSRTCPFPSVPTMVLSITMVDMHIFLMSTRA